MEKYKNKKERKATCLRSDLSPESLEAQADALLAAAAAWIFRMKARCRQDSRPGKAAKAARPEADHVMTDEEAKKAGIVRLDDKQVAALPAASWLMRQRKAAGAAGQAARRRASWTPAS